MNKKRILSAFMALCMIFSIALCTKVSVSAKTAKGVKLTFNGKSITLNAKSEPKTLEEIEKIWGRKTRLAKDDEEYVGHAYVWEKGKSKIIVMQPSKAVPELEDALGYARAEVSDKNASVAGVKVGMTRTVALKKLQKAYGKKNVKQMKNGKTYTEITVSVGNGMPVSYSIKNDKISSICWMRS